MDRVMMVHMAPKNIPNPKPAPRRAPLMSDTDWDLAPAIIKDSFLRRSKPHAA